MADFSAVPIKGRVARFIQVDTCGNPITGASGLQVITKGFISVGLQPEYEDGEKLRQKLADGTLCVNDNDPNEFTDVLLTVTLCGVCPSIQQIIHGARLLTGGAPVSGTGAAYAEGPVTARYALEVWQSVTGRGACDPNTGAPKYVYWAFPNVGNTKIGQSTIENAGLQMQFTAQTDNVGLQWGDGPGTLGPWAPTFVDGEHFMWNITTVAPPTIPTSCGATQIT
jgi:hypothetical protein